MTKSKHIFRIFVRKNSLKVLTTENMFDIIQNIKNIRSQHMFDIKKHSY